MEAYGKRETDMRKKESTEIFINDQCFKCEGKKQVWLGIGMKMVNSILCEIQLLGVVAFLVKLLL